MPSTATNATAVLHHWLHIPTVWGPVRVQVVGHVVLQVILPDSRLLSLHPFDDSKATERPSHPVAKAFQAYFSGQAEALTGLAFELPPHTTSFQRRVWQALRLVPLGETRSYRWLSEAVDCPKGAQAVGGALKANPLPLLIPCHRIIRQSGELGGFLGQQSAHGHSPALQFKQALLTLERQSLAGV